MIIYTGYEENDNDIIKTEILSNAQDTSSMVSILRIDRLHFIKT